jgi:hypothetical protein
LSAVVTAKPTFRIGDMRGETSMAPMITGALFVIKPLSAMRLATMSVENYPMVMLTSR